MNNLDTHLFTNINNSQKHNKILKEFLLSEILNRGERNVLPTPDNCCSLMIFKINIGFILYINYIKKYISIFNELFCKL